MRAWNIFSCRYSLFEAQFLIPWDNLITFSFLEIQKEQQFHSYKSTSWKANLETRSTQRWTLHIVQGFAIFIFFSFMYGGKKIYVVEIYNICWRPLVLLWTLNFWIFCHVSLLFIDIICLMLKFLSICLNQMCMGISCSI